MSFGNEGLSHRATLKGGQTLIKDPKPNGGSTSPKSGVGWGVGGGQGFKSSCRWKGDGCVLRGQCAGFQLGPEQTGR